MRTVVMTLALLGLVPAHLAAAGDRGPGPPTLVPSIPFVDARPAAARTTAGGGGGAWYAYTPTEDQTVHFTATSDECDPALSVWAQDERGTTLLQSAAGAADGAPALVRARLTAGTTYIAHVGGSPGGRGRVVFRVEQARPGLSSVEATITGVTLSWNGAVTVVGAVCSDRSGWADVYPQVTQSVGPFVAHADGHVGTECGALCTTWSASLQSSTWIRFGAGRMTVSAVVWAYDRYGSASSEVAPAWYRADPTG